MKTTLRIIGVIGALIFGTFFYFTYSTPGYVEEVGKELSDRSDGWGPRVVKAARILKEGDEIGKRMEVVGEEGTAIDDMIIYLKAELYDFAYLQQNAFDKTDEATSANRQRYVFDLIIEVLDQDFQFNNKDEARKFFQHLQQTFINWNSSEYESEEFKQNESALRSKLEEGKMAINQ